MDTGRTSAPIGRRKDDPIGSRGNTPVGGTRAKPRKKAKTTSKLTPSPSPRSGPIPTPYLALAPTPISSLSSRTIDQLASNAIATASANASSSANANASASSSNLILPSSYIRSAQHKRNKSTSNLNSGVTPNATENEPEAGPSNLVSLNRPSSGPPAARQQQKYVTSLLSPPTIIPGGTSAIPRIQQVQATQPPNSRRRSGDRERGVNSRRSQERLRELVIIGNNPSVTSLGQLGQILESGHLPENQLHQQEEEENALVRAQQDAQNATTLAQRRRRRIVRGENGATPQRRLTVSSREEGRAIGLARGASMRRTNVWDDIPESGEPPPPFPFPTTSTSRLPPAFAPPAPNPLITTSSHPNDGTRLPEPGERPRSPPPSFEQAIGLLPSPTPEPHSTTTEPTSSQSTPRASRPALTLSTTDIPQVDITTPDDSPSSTHYASAPSSPTHTIIGFEDIRATERERTKQQERDDRRAWNEDLLAGYTLEERVRREIERRQNRNAPLGEFHHGIEETESEGSTHEPSSPVELQETVEENPTENQQAIVEQEELEPSVANNEPIPIESENLSTSTEDVAIRPPAEESTPEDNANIVIRSATPSSALEPIIETVQPLRRPSSPTAAPGNEPISKEVQPGSSASPFSPETSTEPDAPAQSASPPEVTEHDAPTPAVEDPISTPTEEPTPPTSGLSDVEKVEERVSPVVTQLPKTDESAQSTPSISTSAAAPASAALPIKERPQPESVATEKIVPQETPKRKKPTRSSTTENEVPPQSSLSPEVKRLSVPEFSPFRPQLYRPTSSSNEPLFHKNGWKGSPELDSSPQLGTTAKNVSEPIKESSTSEIVPFSKKEDTLPPNREAALRRRNLESKSTTSLSTQRPPPLTLSKPKVKVKMIEQKPTSGPLINFDTPTPSPPNSAVSSSIPRNGTDEEKPKHTRTPSFDISALAASSAELLSLLELQNDLLDRDELGLEAENEPIAESSAQGAARMAKKPFYPPPPPPPPMKKIGGPTLRRVPPPLPKDDPAGNSPKSPIKTKDESLNKDAEDSVVQSDTVEKPSVPPRRAPPPPPPVPRLNLIPQQPPPLPPRPPAVRARSTSSSISFTPSAGSNSTIKASPPPRPAITPRLSLIGQGHTKPKGPRPPPPPPRARQTNWFKNFSPFNSSARAAPAPSPISPSTERPVEVVSEGQSPIRPVNERAQTDFPHLLPPAQEEEEREEKERVIERSSSAMNLRSAEESAISSRPSSPLTRDEQATLPLSDVGQSAGHQGGDNNNDTGDGAEGGGGERREWTDLDLLVSSIERLPSRQFESYNRISDFLGPSKSTAATQAAIDNLLVGLIQVDSRRVTTQGKIKLKLSLFGLRVNKCGICLSQFKQNEKAIMLPMCSHVGHESCSKRWFREKSSCWVCREVLPEE